MVEVFLISPVAYTFYFSLQYDFWTLILVCKESNFAAFPNHLLRLGVEVSYLREEIIFRALI